MKNDMENVWLTPSQRGQASRSRNHVEAEIASRESQPDVVRIKRAQLAAQCFVDDLARSFLAETRTEHEQASHKIRRCGALRHVAIAVEKQQTVKLVFTLLW